MVAARLQEEGGVETVPREGRDSDVVAIGTIERSLTAVGVTFEGPFWMIGDIMDDRFPGIDGLEIALGDNAASEMKGATVA